MAFNREFLITWDELASSLQLLFQDIQNQNTDNRNDINDLENKITDNTQEIEDLWKDSEKQQEEIDNLDKRVDQIDVDIDNINESITNIEGDITNIEGDITNIKGDITNIEQDIDNVENITNNIIGMTADGEQGQVVKIDKNNNGLFADDNFHELNVFDNDDDISEFKNSFDYDISMKSVFDTWQQNQVCSKSIVDNGLFSDYSTIGPLKNVKDSNWKYEDGNLVMGLNQTVYSMFISLDKYNANIYIEIILAPVDKNDDDIVTIIIGYKDLEGNNYATLEGIINGAVKGKTVQHKYDLVLTYNFAQSDNIVLSSKPKADTSYVFNKDNYAKLKVVKNNNKITVSRSLFYRTEQECIDSSYYLTLEYTLPSSKPSNMTQEQYNNLKEMFGSSQIGFGTLSWNCKFKVLSSNISGLFGDIWIYNLKDDSIQIYDNINGKWTNSSSKVSDVIPYRVLLYNDFNSSLFFYYYKQKYCKINHNGG